MNVPQTLLLAVVAAGALLALIWGPLLAQFMLLDPLAQEAATVYGAVAGGLAGLSASMLAMWRLRTPVSSAFPLQAALDLTFTGAVAALVAWWFMRVDPRVPEIEGFSLLCLQVGFASAGGLLVYVVGRGQIASTAADPQARLPSVRSLLVYTTVVLALFTAVLLGIGSAGRAAGLRDQREGMQISALTELMAAALAQTTSPAVEQRLLELLDVDMSVRAEVRPMSDLPPLASPGQDWSRDGRQIVLAGGRRWHLVRRTVGQGVLWLRAPANVRPPVRAPDDTVGLLLLALLLLAAPIGAGLIGRNLSTSLAQMAGELRAMGPSAPTEAVAEGVPVESNDEIGDLAAALNRLCRRFATENSRLAADLAAAEAVDRARSQFLAASSQSLRTPLDRIEAHCEILALEANLTPAQLEDLAAIQHSTEQLLGHVGDILKLSKLEAGDEQPLNLAAVDVGALVRTVMQSHGQSLAEGVVSAVHVSADLPPVQADLHRIRQVVANLVSNAAKFTKAGFIEATVLRGPDGGVQVEVADSGPGIPSDELERIFEEFHRVEAQRDVAGTGLGLAISRRIVERHGGSLTAESALGEGSRFTLILPEAPP